MNLYFSLLFYMVLYFLYFLYLKAGNGGNGHRKLDNPPPGIVLDHTVTRKDW